MGLFGKIKDIFYDEEEIEVEEKEVKKPRIEEINIPKKENTIKEEVVKNEKPSYSERELFKSEPTFKFPIIDEEEEEKPKPQTRSGIRVLDLDKPSISRTTEVKREEPKVEKTFKPSPIISPIYGILDKNYTRDEIVEKTEVSRPVSKEEMNYDYVRRKAYGTLEDELENTLTRMSREVSKSIDEVKEEVESLEETTPAKSIESLLNEIQQNSSATISEIEEKIKDIEEEEEEASTITEEIHYKKTITPVIEDDEEDDDDDVEFDNTITGGFADKTLEHDLFNLIDSMYEDKEEE